MKTFIDSLNIKTFHGIVINMSIDGCGGNSVVIQTGTANIGIQQLVSSEDSTILDHPSMSVRTNEMNQEQVEIFGLAMIYAYAILEILSALDGKKRYQPDWMLIIKEEVEKER